MLIKIDKATKCQGWDKTYWLEISSITFACVNLFKANLLEVPTFITFFRNIGVLSEDSDSLTEEQVKNCYHEIKGS